MMNIFSIFDPTTSSLTSMNWLSMFLFTFFLPYQFWVIPSRLLLFWNKIYMYIHKEFKSLINYSFSNLIIFTSLLFIILFNNFLGLFPYIFTASSHMSFCLSLSLSLWISMMIYSIYNFLNDLFSHLTPQGTPFMLMPFMVFIETISLIIRPFTLAIRLTANMIAGHLLLSLLGSSGSILTIYMIHLMVGVQIMLFTLEMAVALIQSYVFSILMTLYSSET